jgi:hypothetical protein
MKKVINNNYTYYENKIGTKSIVFIPGGPGISGTYWDEYIGNYDGRAK